MLIAVAFVVVMGTHAAAEEPAPAPAAAENPTPPVAPEAPAPAAETPPAPTAPTAPTAPATPEKKPRTPTPEWDDIPNELERASSGGIDVCEAAAFPLGLIPGVGGAVDTIAEWLCLVPATIAVDTVAVQFGGRDSHLWQAGVAVLAEKLFEDLISTPLDIIVALAVLGVVGTVVGSAVLSIYFIPGFPIFLPTLVAIAAGTLLAAPVAFLKHKGGEWVFEGIIMALTNRTYGADLEKAQSEALLQPGDVGWTRGWILMTAAAGSDAEGEAEHFIPVVGPLLKSGDEAEVTKERMRRVGRDMLRDPPGRDLGAMDATVDALSLAKGVTGAVGEGLALTGLGVGITGMLLPVFKASDQATSDTVGFVGLGIALTGLGVYALSTTVDGIKTFAVPCAYGCTE